jgi:hypothetical protein
MGVHNAPSKMMGEIKTYYVTDTTQEDLGNGNVLVRNYRRRNGVLVPEFNCIIASPNLLKASTRFTAFVQMLVNREPWRDVGAKIH